MSCYITFGQAHTHRVNGVTLDCDSVAKVRDRDQAFELFGPKFGTSYTEEEIMKVMHYFPRGIIDLCRPIETKHSV